MANETTRPSDHHKTLIPLFQGARTHCGNDVSGAFAPLVAGQKPAGMRVIAKEDRARVRAARFKLCKGRQDDLSMGLSAASQMCVLAPAGVAVSGGAAPNKRAAYAPRVERPDIPQSWSIHVGRFGFDAASDVFGVLSQ